MNVMKEYQVVHNYVQTKMDTITVAVKLDIYWTKITITVLILMNVLMIMEDVKKYV